MIPEVPAWSRSRVDSGASSRYWELEGDELAKAVTEIAEHLKGQCGSAQFVRYRAAIARYESMALDELDPRAWSDAQDNLTEALSEVARAGLTKFGLARSVADTVHADLIARARPRPRLITTGAEWKLQQSAKRLERAVIGQLMLRQGAYTDVFAVRDAAMRLAGVCGVCYLRVFPGTDRVHVELVYPWRLLHDQFEAEDGAPMTFVLRDCADKDRLIDLYVDGPENISDEERTKRLVAIESAKDASLFAGGGNSKYARLRRTAETYELHRAALGPESPGIIALVCNGVVLDRREWKRQGTQFVRYVWSPWLQGWGGTGIVQQAAGFDTTIDDLLRRTTENFQIRNGKRTYYERGSLNVDDLEKNDAETFVEITPGAQMPQEAVVPPLAPGEVEFISFMIRTAFEAVGVSQMAATSQKAQGVTAAKAIRAIQDIFTKRFAPQGKLLDAADLDLFSKMIWALQDTASENPGIKLRTRWKGSEFFRTIDWKKANLEEELYDVELQAESELASSVPGRIQTLEEGMGAGLISPLTFSRVTEGTLDVQATTEVDQEQYSYLEDLIDQMLNADPDDDPPFVYDPPEGLLPDKAGALAQLTAAYFRAKRRAKGQQDAEYNLEMLRTYIAQIDQMIAKAAAGAQAAQAQPPPITPGTMPGASLGAPGTAPPMLAA
jgi:hypothetical protein